MKFVERQPFADLGSAARRIVEIRTATGGGWLNASISHFWRQWRKFCTRVERAVALGWLWRHKIGTCLKITEGAAPFA
jgi:hypothetical protein